MDARIKAWQDYLKSGPLGVGYGGPSDGVMNDQLKGALRALEAKLREAKKPMTLLSGESAATDVAVVKTLIEQVAKEQGAAQQAEQVAQQTAQQAAQQATQAPANAGVVMWKKYLQGKGLYSGDVNSGEMDDAFKKGMQALEGTITKKVPTVAGMIWQNGQINPQATVQDIEEALKLLAQSEKPAEDTEAKPEAKTASGRVRFDKDRIAAAFARGFEKGAVANFDALGPPDDPEYIGTPFKQMFISQEDSKLDDWSPKNNQNQGKWQSDVPEKPAKPQEPETPEPEMDIEERMERLMKLMQSLKK